MSALLSYMLISGLFGRKNLFSVDVEVEFPTEIFAGRVVPVKVKLINKSRIVPAFLIQVLVQDHRILFPYLAAGAYEMRFFNARFERRGQCRIDDLYIASVFPFNFFTRFRKLPKTFNLTIFPAPRTCNLLQPDPRISKLKGSDLSNMTGFDSEILSIRDYISGDPLRYISWKSTAKTGHLKTKELSSIHHRQIIINFDKLELHDLEFKVSCVTFTILKLFRSSTPVGLIISGRTYRPSASNTHRRAMLKELAVYGQG